MPVILFDPGQNEILQPPGDLAHLQRGSANGSKLKSGLWMLEYARGNIPSLFPFALGDTLFSTLDASDLRKQLGVSSRLMLKEALLFIDERRRGTPFTPNLDGLQQEPAPGKRPRRPGRANVY